ncbi:MULTISPECIES: CidA/LrgA family protein [unclassified Paludibacterium]|uniref:CidA/LrgA family protein n=1 Tax=unclassified Paludibacterium TaxID=2618429 RepID=UPI00207B6429|nr:CidA/LrgA family protein [Paludibacterium sp. B53371]BEV72644.1 CidA/LrgA family protein [Paludibacterium sp. THUN1379]
MKLSRLLRTVVQVALICLLLWLCNLLVAWSHLPLPGSVLGLGILALLLIGKVVPENVVELGAAWLLADMLLFFIPPVVAVLKYGTLISQSGLSLFVVLLGGTATVMIGTALVVDRVFAFETRLREGKQHA